MSGSLSFPSGGFQQTYHYSIRGRVIDSHQNPVSKAAVYLDPPAGAHQIFGSTSDSEGKFYLKEDLGVQLKRKLYVTAPTPDGVPCLICPPFNLLPRLNGSIFQGKSIVFKPDEEINIGDIPVQIYYGLIKIRISNKNNEPLLTDEEKWRLLYFRIRAKEGKVVAESGISIYEISKAVNPVESTITIALPDGVWYLEVSLPGNRGDRLKAGGWLEIIPPYDLKEIILIPPSIT